MHKKVNIAIIGASGYTGIELIRLLCNHPYVNIKVLAAERNAGQPVVNIYSHLYSINLPDLITISDIIWDEIDVVFCCLPHATSQSLIKKLPEHLKIIDLSADFRLNDIDLYEQYYGNKHQAPNLQKNAVYGLSEVYRDEIKNARLVACPGCYPSSAVLPLIPLLQNAIIEPNDIIIDSKSGISGAGRSAKTNSLFCEVNESTQAYAVCNHRHIPEIEQSLTEAANATVMVEFVPHLVPMSRGMLTNCYVKTATNVNIEIVRKTLQEFYKNSSFISIMPEGYLPSTRDVIGTNHCYIGIFPGRTSGRMVLISVIDNLIKGASGQAVQNMNIMYEFDEITGLNFTPIFP